MISKERTKEIGEFVNKNGFDVAMDFYKVSEHSLNRYLRMYRKDIEDIPKNSYDVKTVQDALLYGNTDAFSNLEIQSVTVNSWGNADNPNKQVKVKLSPKEITVNIDALVEEFKEAVNGFEPTFHKPIYREQSENRKMMEINVSDLHFGLLAHREEAGEDYDLKIAKQVYLDSIHHLLQYARSNNVEKILLPVGNDFFNSDTIDATTTAGTKQSQDGRWYKAFTEGCHSMRDAVDMCREVADVEVIVVPANHDRTSGYYSGMFLQAWYRNDNHVNITNSPKQYQYVKYGKNLLGYTHGDGAKSENLPMLMAVDVPQLWADCPYREFHHGHLHTSATKQFGTEVEKIGCKVVSIPSLASASDWIAKMGYRSVREAQAFLYDYNYGRTASYSYRPSMPTNRG